MDDRRKNIDVNGEPLAILSMNVKTRRVAGIAVGLLIVILSMMIISQTAMAASKKRVSTWYTSASGKTYYFDKNGEKVKNRRKKINGKIYYFNEKGVQQTGWQKVGDDYFYFNIGQGADGYMLKSTTVNGIRLKSGGRPVLTSYSREKLPVLVAANTMMYSITRYSDTQAEKLRKCFDYTVSYIRYANLGSFYNHSNWDLYYAKRVFINGNASGNCFVYAVVFAYLANAVGYDVNVVSSGGHGWAEINNLVYDPDWSMADHGHNYFGMSYSTTGANVPRYAANRYSVIAI